MPTVGLAGRTARRRWAVPAAALALAWPGLTALRPQDDAEDARRLIEVLELRAGSAVADVGAGSGVLTLPMARHVGPAGRVYSTEISQERLREIREAVEAAALENVTLVEGASAAANLPEGCCDAVFMRNVYHHFGDPAAMNASLHRSLRPGGRLAVVDFTAPNGASAPPGRRSDDGAHGVEPATVIEELAAAGFVRVREVEWPGPRTFLVVAERPEQ